MQKLLQWATLCGYKTLWMEIRKDNLAMLRLAKAFWFEVSSSKEDMVYVQKKTSPRSCLNSLRELFLLKNP
jgi:hypothetical protein